MIFLKINFIHDFYYSKEEEFEKIQKELSQKISLRNNFDLEHLRYIAGVDLAYWEQNGKQYGVCSIAVIDYKTKRTLKKVSSFGEVTVPYVAGYLAFRELPLFLSALQKLSYEPDLFIFDGNGYLHYNNMGIATHASFFIDKPTIGVAKSYLKVKNTLYDEPVEHFGAHTDIIIDGKVYGRALRTRKDAKPVFVSCGNFIDIDTATKIVLEMTGRESRVPIPTRIADLETHVLRKELDDCL